MVRMQRIQVLLTLCLLILPARAATFIVTNGADSGPGTLRQSILDANVTHQYDEILIHTDVALLSPLPAITTGVAIDGLISAGVRAVVRSPAGEGTVFTFAAGSTSSRFRNIEIDGYLRSIIIENGVGDLGIGGSRLHNQVVASGHFALIGGIDPGDGNDIDEVRITGGHANSVWGNVIGSILVTGGDTHYIGTDNGNRGNRVSGRISVTVPSSSTSQVVHNTVINSSGETTGIYVETGGVSIINDNYVEGYEVGIATRSFGSIERNTVIGNGVGIELSRGPTSSASGTVVGGNEFDGNEIHGNAIAGIRVIDASNIWILRNSIYTMALPSISGPTAPHPMMLRRMRTRARTTCRTIPCSLRHTPFPRTPSFTGRWPANPSATIGSNSFRIPPATRSTNVSAQNAGQNQRIRPRRFRSSGQSTFAD